MGALRGFLENAYDRYHRLEYLDTDPLWFVHQYDDSSNQEAVALLAALLAYGRVSQIKASVAGALTRIESLAPSPASFVENLARDEFQARARRAFAGWVHRFNTGDDVVELFRLLSRSWFEHGSLGSHLCSQISERDPNFSSALDRLIGTWQLWSGAHRGPRFTYLLTAPSAGSCCKRWCMLLRWMVRKDALDLGLWSRQGAILPAQLVMPLDTHTGRICRNLGVTQRRNLGWNAAVEITEAFNEFSPQDPTRFDFSLARVGMMQKPS